MRTQKKKRPPTFYIMLSLALTTLVGTLFVPTTVNGESLVSYRSHIFPIFQNKCMECHKHGGEGQVKSGLDLSSYGTLMVGTKFGPIVVPGDPLTSNLSVLVEGRAHPSIRMPFKRDKLTNGEIRMIRTWIKQGAQYN